MTAIPFDTALLDRLMDAAGLDLLLVSSKHNVQYLLGDYRFFFFDYMDAVGKSRYLPIVIYPKGAPGKAGYIGNRMEAYEKEVRPFWVAEFRPVASGSVDAMQAAVEHVRRMNLPASRIGIESGFLPADATEALRKAFPDSRFTDALGVLERLRARKTPAELDKLRRASEGVIASMLAVIGSHGAGTTKRQLVEALRREEVSRGLTFEYCLITAGTSLNRAPSDQVWRDGDILSLDSGGNYQGYIGDICRVAILGEPDSELRDMLAEVDAIQQAAMRPIRHGARGGEIYAGAESALGRSPNRDRIEFVAHGMGLVTHEVPHLTDKGPVPYPAEDRERPLESGMVLSIETTLQHPRRGFIKLEDTVAVTESGFEMLGTEGRGWNRGRI
ncbi:MAG TPA: Xaa-Pro peptidase family protein [Acetobacteraceae bacterium]|nr:Xaa-Pro peptidase family protein [Acetobacteraceae bacterium]